MANRGEEMWRRWGADEVGEAYQVLVGIVPQGVVVGDPLLPVEVEVGRRLPRGRAAGQRQARYIMEQMKERRHYRITGARFVSPLADDPTLAQFRVDYCGATCGWGTSWVGSPRSLAATQFNGGGNPWWR